jgi:hypothetical protein
MNFNTFGILVCLGLTVCASEIQVQHMFFSDVFISVLGICDILVWIRIPGSVPLTYGSGSDSFLH